MDKANGSSAGSAVSTGLRGVVAAASSIGDVNGEKGELIYQGINIHDLATKSTFEEVVFLLWNGRLPKKAELDELRQNLAASYELQPEIIEVITGMAARVPSSADPMDRLRTVVSALAMFDPEIRDKICRGKESAEEWAEVHRIWHQMGQHSTCTMLTSQLGVKHKVVAYRDAGRPHELAFSGAESAPRRKSLG